MVDPEQRISVLKIVQHPWLVTVGNNAQEYWLAFDKQNKMQVKNDRNRIQVDQEIMNKLTSIESIDINYLKYSVENGKINTFTAGYYILLLNKLDQIEKIKKSFRRTSNSLTKSQSYTEDSNSICKQVEKKEKKEEPPQVPVEDNNNLMQFQLIDTVQSSYVSQHPVPQPHPP